MSEGRGDMVVPPPTEGRTTVLIWRSAADFFSKKIFEKNFEKNFSTAGVSGSAIQAASAALTAPGLRAPIPAPDAASWEAFARAGSALNSALRARHIRGPGAGPLARAAADVAAAADPMGLASRGALRSRLSTPMMMKTPSHSNTRKPSRKSVRASSDTGHPLRKCSSVEPICKTSPSTSAASLTR